MMCTDTGLHADQTGWHIGKPCLHLAPRPLLPQHDCATLIEADDVERVLADIDADHGDRIAKLLSHGRAPFIECLLPAYLLTEQEHGRTIPLAVIKPNRLEDKCPIQSSLPRGLTAAGRAHDDADGSVIRGVRTRDAPRANLGRPRRSSCRRACRWAAEETRCRQTTRDRRKRHLRPQDWSRHGAALQCQRPDCVTDRFRSSDRIGCIRGSKWLVTRWTIPGIGPDADSPCWNSTLIP